MNEFLSFLCWPRAVHALHLSQPKKRKTQKWVFHFYLCRECERVAVWGLAAVWGVKAWQGTNPEEQTKEHFSAYKWRREMEMKLEKKLSWSSEEVLSILHTHFHGHFTSPHGRHQNNLGGADILFPIAAILEQSHILTPQMCAPPRFSPWIHCRVPTNTSKPTVGISGSPREGSCLLPNL